MTVFTWDQTTNTINYGITRFHVHTDCAELLSNYTVKGTMVHVYHSPLFGTVLTADTHGVEAAHHLFSHNAIYQQWTESVGHAKKVTENHATTQRGLARHVGQDD